MGSKHQTVESGPLKIEIIDPLAGDSWDEIVTAHEDHTVFHRSAWARVLAETYGHRPYYLEISSSGQRVALVPLMEVASWITGRRGVSIPFSDFGGPLWTDLQQSARVYKLLLELAAKQKWKHLEIRGDCTLSAEMAAFRIYESHHLDLRQGIDAISRNLDGSVRQAIRKAENSGIQAHAETSLDAVNTFYDLHARTRKRHGLPPQPASFFRAIAKNLIEKGLGTVILARREDTPVAGAVFLYSGNRAIYKFGASDSEHWPSRPNHSVMWKAIRLLVEKGCTELHFGRTASNDHGLLRFKRSWGAQASRLSYFRHSCRSGAWLSEGYQPVESHALIFGNIPIFLSRIAGQLIYPHLD